MSNKSEKKARKIYRKEFREKYLDFTEELAKKNSNFLKTKPDWVPMFIWLFGLKIFVKIK